MDLLLVRHAEPVRIEGAEGPADPPLTELGILQAEATARWLATEDIDAIYASPLRRAVQTGEAVARPHGLELKISDGLAEFDRLSSFYIPYEEMKANRDPHWQALAEDRLADVVEDAETFKPRVVEAVAAIIDAHPGERVVAVCHGGVINVALSEILDLSRDLWFEPAYASISRVAAARQGYRSVVSLNETGHLRSVG